MNEKQKRDAELIKMLRDWEKAADCDSPSWVWDMCGEAADRIEELTKALRDIAKDIYDPSMISEALDVVLDPYVEEAT